MRLGSRLEAGVERHLVAKLIVAALLRRAVSDDEHLRKLDLVVQVLY